MLFLLFGTHIYFTVGLNWIQRKIPKGIQLSLQGSKENTKGLSPYSALATSLAATIGTGNIVGISTAIAIGGPGAIFWCWLTGVLGIATCYAECFLSVRYRKQASDGSCYGGPMYVLEGRLKKRGLAVAFALFTVLASFGIGSSVQAYSIRTAVEEQVSISPHVIGIVVGVLAGVVIIGGSKQIARVSIQQISDYGGGSNVKGKDVVIRSVRAGLHLQTGCQDLDLVLLPGVNRHIPVDHSLTGEHFRSLHRDPAFSAGALATAGSIRTQPCQDLRL